MSATRLLVLGVVRMEGQAHGYQVRRALLSWGADSWANVAPGSVYHALKKLTREGLLAEVAVEDGESGPERTVYRLTEDGDTEFHVLLAKSLTEPVRGVETLHAAVTFLTALPRRRAIELLTFRLTTLRGLATNAGFGVESNASMGKPAHVRELFRLWELDTEASIRWTSELIDRLAAGEYTMADDDAHHFGHPPTTPAVQ